MRGASDGAVLEAASKSTDPAGALAALHDGGGGGGGVGGGSARSDWSDEAPAGHRVRDASQSTDVLARPHLRPEQVAELASSLKLEDFRMVKVLGSGAFGKVVLAEYRESGELFALKLMNKTQILEEDMGVMVLREKDVLQSREQCKLPFFVRLHCAFQTEAQLVLGTNLAGGGSLKSLLKRAVVLSERVARFYLAEMVLALRQLHSEKLVHRDLKLDNVLLGADGHVQLADFGMARPVGSGFAASSVCGTPEFLSFEVVSELVSAARDPSAKESDEALKATYNGRATDWWALGVCAYQLIVGRTPFVHPQRKVGRTIMNIYKHDGVQFPEYLELSEEARSLVVGLLAKDVADRLAFADRLMEHPFFEGINWERLAERQVEPPYRPKGGGSAADAVSAPKKESSWRSRSRRGDASRKLARELAVPAGVLAEARWREFAGHDALVTGFKPFASVHMAVLIGEHGSDGGASPVVGAVRKVRKGLARLLRRKTKTEVAEPSSPPADGRDGDDAARRSSVDALTASPLKKRASEPAPR
eukprot:PLAT7992.1.p1 GENE.PLAT7992.1~~PLAT7992.1.p1  ORF type:complete len:626 (+),score=261.89 PLAT7992.1:277-1878(+)